MNILGVDPGTRFAGFSVMQVEQNRKIVLKEAGCLILPPTESLAKRLKKIYDFLNSKIVESNVHILALETPFMGKNAQNFLKLGYVRGIMYLLSEQHNLKLEEFAPKEIKKSITGSGNAEKDQVARVLMALFPAIGNASIRNDITDAVAVSFCAALHQ